MAYSAPRLRPLGVGDLLDGTVTLYRRNFLLFIGIGAIVVLPVALLQIPPQVAMYSGDLVGMVAGAMLSGIINLVSGLATVAMLLAAIHAISEVYLGRRTTIGAAYRAGLRRYWSALGLGILTVLALTLMAITILGIPVAIYFGICWAFATQALLLEGLGIRKAMGRSRTLVKGQWWRVLGILILLGIIQGILQTVFSVPQILLAALLTGDRSMFALALLSVFSTLLSAAAHLIGQPIWMGGLVLLYYDLRVRKEGFDLELMASDVEAAPQATA